MVLLAGASACGGPTGGNGAAPAATASLHGIDLARRHAQCMREHGVPEEDPKENPDGSIEHQRYDKDAVDQATLGAAIEACRPYEPVLQGPGADEKIGILRDYAKCMRERGVEDFPDPDANGRIQLPEEQTDPDYDTAKAYCDAHTTTRSPSAAAKR
ncbi:hypothetical protein GCM10010170_076990 [Dactylosporangium salmoneum]|uniref:Lipoprotein n=2 Tax=Dactylosporangium salmoneum TaxID=53361 RepID=A0ABN3HBL9_9ACTN